MELGEMGVTANGYRNSWDDGNGLNLDSGDSCTTLCEYTQSHWIVKFKWANCIIGGLPLS